MNFAERYRYIPRIADPTETDIKFILVTYSLIVSYFMEIC